MRLELRGGRRQEREGRKRRRGVPESGERKKGEVARIHSLRGEEK